MASAFVVSRNHLIFGLCLPLAILLGYLLAEPLESTSLAIVVMVLAVLCVPVLMRWYHPLLIVSLNATVIPFFLPGRPPLWVLMAALGLLFALLNRSVNPAHRFLQVPAVTRSLVFLLLVVVATALTTGGFGMQALGSASFGGKGYFYLFMAVAAYFALTSKLIPPSRAGLYVSLFFLSGLTAITSHLAYLAGPKFYFLYELFPADYALDQAGAEGALNGGIVRLAGMVGASLGLYSFTLSRYGIEGVFDFTKPWRMVLFFGAVIGCTFAGFRSVLVLLGLTFVILFVLERLWRTRVVLVIAFLGMVGVVVLLVFSNRLPLSVQRTLSFLPLNIDPLTRQTAQSSTEWRVEMWRTVVPQIPRYLFKGKGYAISPDDVYLIQESNLRGLATSYDGAALAGDFHNGPLSVIIPFGLYGVVAFLWFLLVGGQVLYRHFRDSPPELRRINAYLFAFFLARIVFFIFVFGALYSEFFYFTGILGLSVALNAGRPRATDQDQLETSPAEIGWSR